MSNRSLEAGADKEPKSGCSKSDTPSSSSSGKMAPERRRQLLRLLFKAVTGDSVAEVSPSAPQSTELRKEGRILRRCLLPCVELRQYVCMRICAY